MKTVTRRCLCLLLSLLMLLPLLACGEGENDMPTETVAGVSEATETEAPPVERTNYNKEFNAYYCRDTYPKGYFFVLDEEREPGNDMDFAVYERMEKVKDYLGVTIVPVNGGGFLEYGAPFKRSVGAGDDEYQMMMTHTYYDVTNFITSGYLKDFKDVDGLNLSADYWDERMMEEDSLDGRYFLGYNDFCLAYVYLLTFNKVLAERYPQQMGGIYDKVRNKKWTLDEMFACVDLVSADDGDG